MITIPDYTTSKVNKMPPNLYYHFYCCEQALDNCHHILSYIKYFQLQLFIITIVVVVANKITWF